MQIVRVSISRGDKPQRGERPSVLFTENPDEGYAGQINLPAYKKKGGRWLSKVDGMSLSVPDGSYATVISSVTDDALVDFDLAYLTIEEEHE